MPHVELDLTIHNGAGERIAATFLTPNNASPAPAVLLCQGLSGVRNLVMPTVASVLADAGIASLRFDYAGHGESSGDRGWINPFARVSDARYVLSYLIGMQEVDPHRVGVYGHSYGGPVALHLAAADPQVRAAVTVSGPGNGEAMLRAPRPAWEWVELKKRVAVDRLAISRGHEPEVVPVNDIFPFSPAFAAAYEKLKASQGGTSALPGTDGLGKTSFYLASVDAMSAFRPEAAAAQLTGCPTMFINGADDDTAPIETVGEVYRVLPGPKRWIIVPDADHNTLDTDPGLTAALADAVSWFGAYL
jgi:pimeloyl-ACP methyl ester carboxylesterase